MRVQLPVACATSAASPPSDSLCLATSLGGQTEQREEPRAVARELGAELCTRMPLETHVVDPMPEPDLIWIEMRRGPRAPARHLAPALWNAIRCCPALRCNILWPSEALRGTQRHSKALRSYSEATSGNQRQSEAIRGNQRQSEAIRGNQRPSEALRGTPRHSEALTSPHSGTQWQSTAITCGGSRLHEGGRR